MRADLSVPQQAVQAVHAAVELARHGHIATSDPHPNLVLCTVPNLEALIAASSILSSYNIRYRQFAEADMDDELTALCTEPIHREQLPSRLRKFLRGLKLFGNHSSEVSRVVN